MPRSTPALRLLAACTLLLGSSLAHAQYAWVDEKGVRHFSDRPPPPSTPAHKILNAPGRAALAEPATSSAPGVAAEPAGPVAKAAPTLAQREAGFRKRALQREEQEKQEAVEAQRRRDLAEHCQAARDTRAQMASGIRIAKVDAKGERSFMTDEERAAQLVRADKALAGCP
jgi:hypothetical protein